MEKSLENFDAVVVGGGVSGLSAAVELSKKKFKVVIIEKNKFLGGRTYSFNHKIFKEEVDNGQHILMGCYKYCIEYLKSIDTLKHCNIQKNLSVKFKLNGEKEINLNGLNLPAPLNIIFGILFINGISLFDKISILIAGFKIKILNTENNHSLKKINVDQFLNSLNQSEKIKKIFWNTISISALNESTTTTSAYYFVKIIQQIFFGSKNNSAIIIPRIGLTNLFVSKAIEFIESSGGRVFNDAEVTTFKLENKSLKQVVLSNQKKINTTSLIIAIPYYAVNKSNLKIFYPKLDFENKFINSAIITIHLWYNKIWMKNDFIALVDSPLQWIFSQSKIRENYNSNNEYLSVVISGANKLISKSNSELINLTISEIEKYFKESKNIKLLDYKIIREKRATFSPQYNCEELRPNQITNYNNVFLAGDWVNTKLPATIEGGVFSGVSAARLAEKIISKN